MPNTATNGARATSSSGTTAARITKPPATTRQRKTASTGGSRSTITGSKPVRRQTNGSSQLNGYSRARIRGDQLTKFSAVCGAVLSDLGRGSAGAGGGVARHFGAQAGIGGRVEQ